VQVDALNVRALYVYSLSAGITSSVCKEGNIVSSKIGAGVILKSFLNMEVDVDNLPEGNEEGISIETVIAVSDVVKEADNVIRYE
jgi:DEAD/DEAH box helicase domain-containing protein